MPIKKSPPIIDIIEEPKKIIQTKIEEIPEDNNIPVEPSFSNVESEILNSSSNDIDNESLTETNSEPSLTSNQIESNQFEKDFTSHWKILFDQIFSHIPIIYFPLKDHIPTIKENIVYIKMKNDIQKEHFEPKVREILSYLRSNFDENIEDVVITVDETIVTKKIIYDTADKMKNLIEQNGDFAEFNTILNLTVKE